MLQPKIKWGPKSELTSETTANATVKPG